MYVIEANPRASRTVPFVAKATGVPLAKVASRVMLGATLAELRAEGLLRAAGRPTATSAVKEAVLPFNRFPEVDTALGPEMRSTGEVMGIDATFGLAFFKAELAAGTVLPTGGHGVPVAGRRRQAGRPGRRPAAARARPRASPPRPGTADYLGRFGVSRSTQVVGKISEGARRSTAVDLIAGGEVTFVINTPQGQGRAAATASRSARPANTHRVSSVTTVEAALAAVQGMAEQVGHELTVRSLQEYHRP